MLRFGSLFSGIEAASVAWHPLGWKTAFTAEVDPFASSVLAHRLPGVANLGDVTAGDFVSRARACGPIDVLVGGSPCQAFSLAGQRRSLADERGNLTLRYVEIADELDPDVVLWENVPGVLNTADNAFGCLLAGLAGEQSGPLVPPRGGWTDAGHVFGPRRNVVWRVLDSQGFGVAQRRRRVWLAACARGRDPGDILVESGSEVRDSAPVTAAQAALVAAAGIRAFGLAGHADYREGCLPTLRASGGDCGGGSEVLVVHPRVVGTICASGAGVSRAAGQGNELDFVIVQQRIVGAAGFSAGNSAKARGIGYVENGVPPLRSGASGTNQVPTVDYGRDLGGDIEYTVRRLMPVECERLQGFPDGWTSVPYRGRPTPADGPRYKALGNSMLTPVIQWIGRRIERLLLGEGRLAA